jgi:DNA end-binding protein Ku
MRSIWKGAVSFGLVSIAVRLYSATEEKDIRFHQIHAEDGGRIRYRRTCQVCGGEVSYDDLAKGYDLGGGEIVVLTDEDLADLPLSSSHAIDVLEFVPAEQVDPILYAKAYYLEPDGAATKPYVLLREALAQTDRVAVVKVALRQREELATLRVRDGVLVLNTMLWPDEVRRPDFGFLDNEVDVRPAELAMAGSLIESMAADFDPRQYTDNYRAVLQQVIAAKVAGREVVAPVAEEPAPTPVVDLMAALRASVDRARAARGDAAGAPPEPARKAPSKTTATRKAAAGRTAAPKTASKTAASKTAGRKTVTGKVAARRSTVKKAARDAESPTRETNEARRARAPKPPAATTGRTPAVKVASKKGTSTKPAPRASG